MKFKFLLLPLILLVCALPSFAQETYVTGLALGSTGRPVAGAHIAICTDVAVVGTTTTPCSPLATIYTDVTGGTPSANPFTADGLGNYAFWGTPGQYTLQVYNTNITTQFGPLTVSCSPTGPGCGGGGTPSNPNHSIQYNNSGAFGGTALLTWDPATMTLKTGTPSSGTDFYSEMKGGTIGNASAWLAFNPSATNISTSFFSFDGFKLNVYSGAEGAAATDLDIGYSMRPNCGSINGSNCNVMVADSYVDASAGQNSMGGKIATVLDLSAEAFLASGEARVIQGAPICLGDSCLATGDHMESSCTGASCVSTAGRFRAVCSGASCVQNSLKLEDGDLRSGATPGPGSMGQVLTSQGANAPPEWSSAGGGTINGTIANTQVAVASGTDTISGSNRLTSGISSLFSATTLMNFNQVNQNTWGATFTNQVAGATLGFGLYTNDQGNGILIDYSRTSGLYWDNTGSSGLPAHSFVIGGGDTVMVGSSSDFVPSNLSLYPNTAVGNTAHPWANFDSKKLTLLEVTAPSGVSSNAVIYADSATHQLKTKLNAGSALFIPSTDGSGVSGHCAQFTSTYEIIDNGTACGGGTGTVTSVGQSFTGGLISVAGSPVTGTGTLALTVAGTSGGVPYFSSGSTWASSAALTANLPVIGGGAGAAPAVGTVSGNTTEFGTVSGALTTQHCIKADASGNLVDNGAACNTGTVTSAGTSFTGGLISVAGSPVTTTGTAALTVAGTSGGVPYFSSASTWASSAALTANLPMIGGGAGAPPAVGTRSGNTTKFVTTTGSLTNGNCVSIDASGNFVDFGGLCGGGGGGGTVTNVALAAPTGFTVLGSPVIASGTLTWAMPSGWTTGSLLLGNGANSAANLGIGAAGTVLSSNGSTASWAATGAGTVTNFSANNITTGTQNFATQGVTNSGTTPALTFTLANAPAHKYFGNNTGGSGAPDYFSLVAADLPSTAVNSVVNDTNIAGSISGQALTFSWLSTLSAARGGTSFSSYTKGDTICPSAATTMTKLGVGTNGQVLTASSGATCGITWATPSTSLTLDTNTVANSSQTLLNFTNTSGASGITFTNPSGGVESATLASVAGGGNATLQGTLTGFATGDLLCGNSTPIIVNCTPGVAPNAQAGTTYTVLTGDRGKWVTHSNASSIAVTLPQAGGTGFAGNFFYATKVIGAGVVTITPTTSTINGAATLVLVKGQQANIFSDDTNYFATVSGTPSALPFASIPTCSSTYEGMTFAVNNSNTNTWGATIAGGGANHVMGYCNGTNLTVAAK